MLSIGEGSAPEAMLRAAARTARSGRSARVTKRKLSSTATAAPMAMVGYTSAETAAS